MASLNQALTPGERALLNRAEEAVDALEQSKAPPAIIQSAKRVVSAFRGRYAADADDLSVLLSYFESQNRVDRFGKAS